MSYTTLCAVVCLAVLCSLAAAHPQPGSNSNNGRENRYLESQPAAQNRVDQSSDEGEAILTAKFALILQQLLLGGLNILAAMYTAYTFFIPFVPRPVNQRSLPDSRIEAANSMGRVLRSLDNFEETHNSKKLVPYPGPSCQRQMLCELRQLVTYMPQIEHLVNSYGVRIPGLEEGYQKALDAGASRQPCHSFTVSDNSDTTASNRRRHHTAHGAATEDSNSTAQGTSSETEHSTTSSDTPIHDRNDSAQKKESEQCPNSILSIMLAITRAISADHM